MVWCAVPRYFCVRGKHSRKIQSRQMNHRPPTASACPYLIQHGHVSDGRATYPDFAHHVTSSGLLPEPLEMGFLLDRMALSAAAHPGIIGAAARGEVLPRGVSGDGGSYEGEGGGVAGGDGWTGVDGVELDLGFLMVAFSAAVNTTPAERMQQVRGSLRSVANSFASLFTFCFIHFSGDFVFDR